MDHSILAICTLEVWDTIAAKRICDLTMWVIIEALRYSDPLGACSQSASSNSSGGLPSLSCRKEMTPRGSEYPNSRYLGPKVPTQREHFKAQIHDIGVRGIRNHDLS